MARRRRDSDFRDLRKKGDPVIKSKRDVERRDWWNSTGAECCGIISDTLKQLARQQAQRLRQNVISARLYGNIHIRGAVGSAEQRIMAAQTAQRDKMSFNVVQSVVDTVTSRVGETKPRPFYLTDGGNYAEQRKAKKLNKYIDGVLYQNKAYDLGLDCFRDSGVWGDGIAKVLCRGGRIVIERALIGDIWVDEVEAYLGKPRRLHHVVLVDRAELLAHAEAERWPAETIKAIDDAERVSTASGSGTSDMVRVCESWNLASPDAKGKMQGGKHAIALVDDDVMLLEPEDYPYDVFPFARLPWAPRPVGYYSQGCAERLTGNQISINKKLWLIDRSMHLSGSFKVMMPAGSKVVSEQVNNEIGTVVKFAGTQRPEYVVVQPIHEMFLLEVDREIERAFEQEGVSQLAAKSAKPAGLNSGKAIREFNDTESDRFRTIQRQNDNFYLQLAHLIVLVSKECRAELAPVAVPSSRWSDTVDFAKDIGDLDLNAFNAQCYPVSRLPKDPAGRMATIQEWVQAGWISDRQGRRLMDFPDLEAEESLANAQEDILTKTLDDICDQAIYAPPEPTDDLILGKEMVIEYIQRGRAHGLEEERLELLRRWNAQVDEMQKMVVAEQAQKMAAMQPPAAPAVPMPPPQSDLLPNAAA